MIQGRRIGVFAAMSLDGYLATKDDGLDWLSKVERPDFARVALPAVGVMDMLRYHKFTIGWGWIPEYGCADSSKADFDNLYGYSPVHNLRDGVTYPSTMVTTADHDDRVVPAHSFKFGARLQAAHSGPRPVLLRVETNAGHGAGKPIGKILDEQADKWAFVLNELDAVLPPPYLRTP